MHLQKWDADSYLLAVCVPFFLHYRGNLSNNAIIPDAIKLPLAPTAKSLRIRKDFFTIPTSSLRSTALIVSSIIVFTFSELSLKVVGNQHILLSLLKLQEPYRN